MTIGGRSTRANDAVSVLRSVSDERLAARVRAVQKTRITAPKMLVEKRTHVVAHYLMAVFAIDLANGRHQPEETGSPIERNVSETQVSRALNGQEIDRSFRFLEEDQIRRLVG